MRKSSLRRISIQRCTAGVVMLMLAAGTVGLAVASDEEPAEAESAASMIDSLPRSPTAEPSASTSPSPATDIDADADDQERTQATGDPVATRRSPEATDGSSGSPSSSPTEPRQRRSVPASPSPTASPPPTAPSPTPSPEEEPRERGPLGDLLAGLLGQD